MNSSGQARPSQQERSGVWRRLLVVALVIMVLTGATGAWMWKKSATPKLPKTLGIDAVATSTVGPIVDSPLLTPKNPSCVVSAGAPNSIIAENNCPGTTSWRQTLPVGPAHAIEAFTAPDSVNIGDTISLYVSTTARSYTFSVYRVGWYRQLGARLLYTSPTIRGIEQPAPLYDPVMRTISCSNWSNSVRLQIPTGWVSGVYIVKFVTSDHFMRYTLFVVRNDASHAPALFQMALMTYQAYNLYGGRSLYYEGEDSATSTRNSDQRAYAVSFDRPYETEAGLGELPVGEGAYIRFLEHEGYDMSYMSDTDLLLNPAPITQHKLLIIGGHDEYYNDGMRQATADALSQGVSLAFFFANSVYWHTRMSDSPLGPDRIITCYRYANLDPLSASNPSATTVQWASPPVSNPPNSLLGEGYLGIVATPAPLVLAPGAMPYLKGTSLFVGASLPDLVGGEVDTYTRISAAPKHVTILTASPVKCKETDTIQTSNATIYTAPSGAMVFDTGAFDWYLGLYASWFGPGGNMKYRADFHDMQRFMINILDALIASSKR